MNKYISCFLLVLMVGCTTRTAPHDPGFRLGTAVRITSGFYAGCTGYLDNLFTSTGQYGVDARCPVNDPHNDLNTETQVDLRVYWDQVELLPANK